MHLLVPHSVIDPKDLKFESNEIYCFLGGRFTDHSPFPIQLRDDAPPEGRVDRWKWFLENVCEAAEHAEGLWKMVTDPVS